MCWADGQGQQRTPFLCQLLIKKCHDSMLIGQQEILSERCRRLNNAAYNIGKVEYMHKAIELVTAHVEYFEAVGRGDNNVIPPIAPPVEGTLRNPSRVRSKGCGGPSSSTQNTGNRRVRKAPSCGVCGRKGHNRKSCIVQREYDVNSSNGLEEDELNDDYFYANTDMVSVNYYFFFSINSQI